MLYKNNKTYPEMNNTNLELPLPAETNTEIYLRIRNYLAGRFVGATRDKKLLEEITKCLFCKVYISQNNTNEFKNSNNLENVSKIYRRTFKLIKKRLPNIFDEESEIELDPNSMDFIDTQLSIINFKNYVGDPIGDLYETFASTTLKSQEGQFFTPQNAIDWLVDNISLSQNDMVIDPACGAGGFLSAVAQYKMRKGGKNKDINSKIYGIEKDKYLSNLAYTHLSITTLETPNIACADSLAMIDDEGKSIKDDYLENFDVVLSNPPFGKKIVSTSDDIRRQFELGYKWNYNPDTEIYKKTLKLLSNVPPQILFIERIISLLKPGGKMGVVVPESMISNASHSYAVEYLKSKMKLSAIIGMPEALFKTSGKGGTHTKTCLIIAEKKSNQSSNQIFMAEAKWCGNDSRGKLINKNDLPQISEDYNNFQKKTKKLKMGYLIDNKKIVKNILCPRYYEPKIIKNLYNLKKTHELLNFGELVNDNIISLSTGDEVGKLEYGNGSVPFIRTSDISNWEIKSDPKHLVSDEIYNKFARRQDVLEGDILFVRDGTYLIGSCGYVSKYDTKILYQSHIYKIRSNDWSKLSPFLLIASLSCEPVIEQIKSKRFTQDIIDTIGNRIKELVLPIPKDNEKKRKIEKMVQKSIFERTEAREIAKNARLEICS